MTEDRQPPGNHTALGYCSVTQNFCARAEQKHPAPENRPPPWSRKMSKPQSSKELRLSNVPVDPRFSAHLPPHIFSVPLRRKSKNRAPNHTQNLTIKS